MGDYYPRGTYYASTAEVEKLGCSPPEFAAARRGCLRRTLRVEPARASAPCGPACGVPGWPAPPGRRPGDAGCGAGAWPAADA